MEQSKEDSPFYMSLCLATETYYRGRARHAHPEIQHCSLVAYSYPKHTQIAITLTPLCSVKISLQMVNGHDSWNVFDMFFELAWMIN